MLVADRYAGGFGVDPNKIGYILNQEQDGIACSEEDVRQMLARWRYLGKIPMSTEWIKAVNRYELIATKNYVELNMMFDQILYQLTNEPVFVPAEPVQQKRKGFLKNILSR
jgi:septum formation inhibitor-activating ATPase MinD